METNKILEAIPAGMVIEDASWWKSMATAMNYIAVVLAPIFTLLQVFYPNLVLPENVKLAIYQVIFFIIIGANVLIAKISTAKKTGVAELVAGSVDKLH